MLSRTEDASYIFEIVKTCRKFNLGLLLINQEVEGMLNSQAGKSVLANSAYTLLMRQKPAVIDSICKTFHLSQSEKTYLLTASVGEGLLIMEDDHSEIKVIASPEEHKLITTKADELIEQEDYHESEKIKPEKTNELKIDIMNLELCYLLKDLEKQDSEYLIDKGYKKFNLKSISSNKKETYLIKPRPKESLNHVFTVYDIARFLRMKKINVEIFSSRKPDVVFEINKKKIALEVESGSLLTQKKQLLEKVRCLNNDFNEWYFILLDHKLLKKYSQYGKTIDRRYLASYLNKITK